MYKICLFFALFIALCCFCAVLRLPYICTLAAQTPTFLLSLPKSAASKQAPEPIFRFSPSRFHDFDTLLQGDWVSHDFAFTNVGNTPLHIERVRGTCYCTKAEWSPQGAVPPGGEGYIRVFYDTRSKLGKFRAAVSIQSNAFGSDTEHLFVEGNIVAIDTMFKK